ncbi:TatD family hydrolase [Salinicola sp. DM10]|uniref:TatD family hydrolase n=1 Tax=Salinicola sp. DM10 TaxID=2815721 RepID=UPI001E48D263|nr:TatD family hydrolase [Salinicola sp. DM10]MCE3028953.1 TatD family hydrolase [Salinicola sp. DM10]
MSDTPPDALSAADSPLPEALRLSAPAALVDIGANLTHESFASDLPAVLARAEAANVRALVVTGADPDGSERACELSQCYPNLWATAGVHPHHAADWDAALERRMRELHAQPRVVAVGECGLDFNRNFSSPAEQVRAFEAQLALAAESGLPLFLHERDAGRRMLEMLHEWRHRLSDAVIHCFTGERDILYGYLDLDLHIGQTGWLSDERRGHHLREFIAEVPAERLMVETDCPYLLPRNLPAKIKGRRHEPALLPWIVRELARWRGEDEETLARVTTRTASRFFRLQETFEP